MSAAAKGAAKKPVTRQSPSDEITLEPRTVSIEYVEKLVDDEDAHFLAPVIKYALLGLICVLSFAIRLFAVVKWESVRANVFNFYYLRLLWYFMYSCSLPPHFDAGDPRIRPVF